MTSSSSSAKSNLSESIAVARILGPGQNRDISPGDIINGHYKVVRQLASGSMGTVYLCQHTKLANRTVAVKIIANELAADPQARERLADEICNTYDVSHPNVIRTYEYFEEGPLCGFSMEFADGGDLLSLSEYRGPLPFDVVVDLLKQICGGVAAIHAAGIVHRDIKPENMLLTRDIKVKVSDFGIAYSKARSRKTVEDNVQGAIDYLSPEYIEHGTFDERSDIFAIGMVAFRLIAGRTPSEGSDVFEALRLRVSQDIPPVSNFRPDCPVFLTEFVRKALSRDPQLRFQTVREMLATINSGNLNLPKENKLKTSFASVVAAEQAKEEILQRRSDREATNNVGMFGKLAITILVSLVIIKLVLVTWPDLNFGSIVSNHTAAVMPAKQVQGPLVDLQKTAATVPTTRYIHTIKYKGETLAVLSQWYTGSADNWQKIAEANPGIEAEKLALGNMIFIPADLLTTERAPSEKQIKQVIAELKTKQIAELVKQEATARAAKKITDIEEMIDPLGDY